jgi:hypothetical protein
MIDDLLRVYDFNLSFDLHLAIYDLDLEGYARIALSLYSCSSCYIIAIAANLASTTVRRHKH